MDDLEFDELKPAKDFEERLQQARNSLVKQGGQLTASLANASTNIGANISQMSTNMPETAKAGVANLKNVGGTLKETGINAGTAAAEKAR